MNPPSICHLQSPILMKAGVPNYFENKGKFVYKRISVYDASTTDLLSDAPEIVAFISKGLNYGSVLVHCQRGVSRSSTAVMFYLMNAAGMSFDNAFKTCQRRRDCVNPIPAFVAQLKEYETECKRKGLIQSNGGEVKSNQTADKKRKVAGPSRGPAPRPMVGPSVPPQEDEKDDEKIKSSSNPDIGPSLPSQKKAKIGPSLPSQQKKKENSSS